MTRIYFALVCIPMFCLLGCASPPSKQLSREEYLTMTTRVYKNEKSERVIAKAEEVLRLADEKDVKFAHKKNGFIAQRHWMMYAVIAAYNGVHYYDFSVEQEGKNIRATLELRGQGNLHTAAISPVIGGAGGVTVTPDSMPSAAVVVFDQASYDLFWHRLEYLLGKQKTWLTCDDMKERVKQGLSEGSIALLCQDQTVDDRAPN